MSTKDQEFFLKGLWVKQIPVPQYTTWGSADLDGG